MSLHSVRCSLRQLHSYRIEGVSKYDDSFHEVSKGIDKFQTVRGTSEKFFRLSRGCFARIESNEWPKLVQLLSIDGCFEINIPR